MRSRIDETVSEVGRINAIRSRYNYLGEQPMVKEEYLRFLQSLNRNDISSNVRKIANLVLQNMDKLIPLTTSQGQRIKKIVELAQVNWDLVSPEIQPIEKEEEQHCPFTHIKNLTVGPFRGFTQEEVIDLDSKLVLIYGPNGTGKSSLCEALEYGLLGSVVDAENKRFHVQHDFLENAYTNRFTPPVLIGTNKQGKDIPITANETLYRFCFIEKNRINNFSRISAQLPGKQTELISTLFGLDAFSNFVRNFTELMDKYIDLEGEKGKTLDVKMQENAGLIRYLESAPDEFKKIEKEERILANEYESGCTFTKMFLELEGVGKQKGKIAQIETELDEPIRTKTGITISSLYDLEKSIKNDIRELRMMQQEITDESLQFSYKQLYETIIRIRESSKNRCPVCHTPLLKATINPYIHAEAELEKLKHLDVLQEKINQHKESINSSLIKVSSIVNTCCLKASEEDAVLAYKLADEQTEKIGWWDFLHKQQGDGYTPWQYLETFVKSIEDEDKEIEKAIQKRADKRKELKNLREFKEKIIILKTRRDAVNEQIHSTKEKIDKSKSDNAQLILEVKAEKKTVKQNKIIAEAYKVFVREIIEYKKSLPAQLVADLGETIINLYNAFNRHDSEHEQLAAVKLPLQQNENLEISYKNNPDLFFDVLHIFSEGHIRCMGLAILAAKNIKENCPFLIFDDPVNAIDDDHRESIRRTIFDDVYFKNKQIILACHGEEFLKDISNTPSSG